MTLLDGILEESLSNGLMIINEKIYESSNKIQEVVFYFL